MTALLKVKEDHLPKCLGCHSYVESMKPVGARQSTSGPRRIPKTDFDCMMDLFISSDTTIGSAGVTIAEGAMLHHYWKRINKGNILITHRGDGSIAKLVTNATRSIEEWQRRVIYLVGSERKLPNEEIAEWIKHQNTDGGQKDRIKLIQGDPSKIIFTEDRKEFQGYVAEKNTREIPFSMVFCNSTDNYEEVTYAQWEHLTTEGMGDFDITSKYSAMNAEGGMFAFANYEKDDGVTDWVDDLCESGHGDMLDRADSVVILVRLEANLKKE